MPEADCCLVKFQSIRSSFEIMEPVIFTCQKNRAQIQIFVFFSQVVTQAHFTPNHSAIRIRISQNSALPGVRANGITSRMFPTPVTNINMRSKPIPNPLCGTEPYLRKSRYHQ